jgi:hypothetical protein
MQESTLHNQLKNYYWQPGDQQETWVDGFLVDILRNDLIIEIQTRNFYAIRPKLMTLVPIHPVLLVHPIIRDKWIVREDGSKVSRRRSPRRGRIEDIFIELIRFPQLMEHPNLTLEVVFIQAEEIRRNDGKGSWRRQGWSIIDRRILSVDEQVLFQTVADFRTLIPPGLGMHFTIRELAERTGITPVLARKMAFCYRQMGIFKLAGKKGNAQILTLYEDHPDATQLAE